MSKSWTESRRQYTYLYDNRNSDTQAYMDSGIPTNIIYLVNSNSVLRRVGDGKRTSYYEHATKVNQKYPKINS